jgi:hypothetical protein
MAWTAMAGKHTFVVPDEHQARALADAFVAFGYPLVMAGPHDMSRFVPERDRDRAVTDWTVTVVDEGPYATDAQGSREWEAVSRSARMLAREHRGYFLLGVEFDVSQLATMVPGRDLLTHRNPGARPARPAPRPGAAAFTRASLSLECEPPRGTGVDLGGLREVPWASLEHAYGPAEDVPALIQGLARMVAASTSYERAAPGSIGPRRAAGREFRGHASRLRAHEYQKYRQSPEPPPPGSDFSRAAWRYEETSPPASV